MEKILVKGDAYSVATKTECVVTSSGGAKLGTATAGKPCTFIATTDRVNLSDSEAEFVRVNPKCAPAGSGGGDGVGVLDNTPVSGSSNAVSSGGLYNVLYDKKVRLGLSSTVTSESVAVGWSAATLGAGGVAIGTGAKAGQQAVGVGYNANATMCNHGIAVGYGAKVSSTNYTMAIGCSAEATKSSGQAFGHSAKLKNAGCTLIGTWESDARTVQTLLYIIAAGSELATQYENGEACLGYVVKESRGNVLACGTRKLSELLTSNTAFAPAAMDLDAPAPMPFLPAGIMEPVEFEG